MRTKSQMETSCDRRLLCQRSSLTPSGASVWTWSKKCASLARVWRELQKERPPSALSCGSHPFGPCLFPEAPRVPVLLLVLSSMGALSGLPTMHLPHRNQTRHASILPGDGGSRSALSRNRIRAARKASSVARSSDAAREPGGEELGGTTMTRLV